MLLCTYKAERKTYRTLFLVNEQRDAQILFYVFISIYNSLHVSSTLCSSSGESSSSLHTSRPST